MPDPAPKYCECVLVITESEAMPDGRMEAVIQFNVFEGITTVKIGCPKCGGTGLRLAEGKIEKVGEVKLNGLPIQIGDILKAAGLTPTDGHAFSFNSPLPPAQTVTTNLKFPTANYSFYDTADADGMKELHCGKYVVRAPAAVVEQLLLRKWEQGK